MPRHRPTYARLWLALIALVSPTFLSSLVLAGAAAVREPAKGRPPRTAPQSAIAPAEVMPMEVAPAPGVVPGDPGDEPVESPPGPPAFAPGAPPMIVRPPGPMANAVAAYGEYVYVLRGNVLYQYRAAGLKLVTKVVVSDEMDDVLPVPRPPRPIRTPPHKELHEPGGPEPALRPAVPPRTRDGAPREVE